MDIEFEIDSGDVPALVLKAAAKSVNPWQGGENGEP
jgi:hypothetical protein